jgi:hypothetical protein
MMMTKKCRDCGETKDVNEFYFTDKKKGTLKSYCKDCSYKRARKHIEKDPVAYKHYMSRYARENPEKFPGNYKTKSMPMQCGVYEITNVLTGDNYIGVSKNIRGRIYKHRKANGRGKQRNLYKLIIEYGWEAFDVNILELCDKEIMFERERYWISKLQPNLNVYNKNK